MIQDSTETEIQEDSESTNPSGELINKQHDLIDQRSSSDRFVSDAQDMSVRETAETQQ
jgi:hypothetical protein